MKLLVFFLILQPSLFTKASVEAIYGDLNIIGIEKSSSKIRTLSRAIAIRLPKRGLVKYKEGRRYPLSPLRSFERILGNKMIKRPVCKNEFFYNELHVKKESCTAFLVTPDILLTSLHCMRSEKGETISEKLEKSCQNFVWAFDYLKGRIRKSQIRFLNDSVYECEKVIGFSGTFDEVDFFGHHYALIKLKEKTNRTPLKIAQNFSDTTQAFMLGFPLGLPMKLSFGGFLQQTFGNYFFMNLDSYAGNSGSPVFDAETHEVIGMLNGGRMDFEEDKQCISSKIYQDIKGREEVYSLEVLSKEIEKL